ncbi:MAG TPA: tyrosine-type recombinase/integrase, partial [Opitutus sp.]|nr:tyrosine-type recombinase/integrase [Opitutus sp.]
MVGAAAATMDDSLKPIPPEVIAEWWQPFADFLAQERRYSAYTLRNYRQAFEDFYRWLVGARLWERGFDALDTRELRDFVIEAQRRFGRRTLHNHVSGLRSFFKFWLRRGRVRRNPFLGVPLPKLEKRLPKFLTEEQVVRLLAGPQRLLENESIDAFTAHRDQLAMELLYGAGLRVSELTGLNYGAIDLDAGVARVLGKGKKERLCPL